MKIHLSVLLATGLSLYGCSLSPELKVRLVIDSKKPCTLLIKEDNNIKLDFSKVYDAVANSGEVIMPKGFVSQSPPVFYRVVQITDKRGNVLAEGDDPAPGQFGFLSLFARGGPGIPKLFNGVSYYFGIGYQPKTVERKKTYERWDSNPNHILRFRLIIPPGFTGELKAVEDPSLELIFEKEYTLRAVNGHVKVPSGFLKGPGTGAPFPYQVIELVDSNGTYISDDSNKRPGIVAVRSLYEVDNSYYKFQIWDGLIPK